MRNEKPVQGLSGPSVHPHCVACIMQTELIPNTTDCAIAYVVQLRQQVTTAFLRSQNFLSSQFSVAVK